MKKFLKMVIATIVVLIVCWGITVFVDYNRVCNLKEPIFVISSNTENDEGTSTYYGLGYKVEVTTNVSEEYGAQIQETEMYMFGKVIAGAIADIAAQNTNTTVDEKIANQDTTDYPYFYGTVIETSTSYVMVEPDEGEDIRRSADKISISLGKDNDMIYPLETYLKITYTGEISESYPAQIDVVDIEIVTEEVQTQISEYIERICNEGISYVGLPEFQDINNANKEWIYSRVTTRVDLYYITEEQIKSELLELFGENLVVDVESDTSDADGYFIPRYNTEKEMYEYIPMGGMIQYSYIIDSITKNGNDYVVDVIEYSEHEDLERDSEEGEEFAYSVFAYDYDEEGWDKIFESDDKTIEEIETQVMEQKSEFPLFTITLEKVDDVFYVKNVERN